MPKDDNHTGCGISPIATGKKDPFFEACRWHDQTYLDKSYAQNNLSREIIDKLFLAQMLIIAGDNFWLKLKARLYYRLARIFGSRFWEGKE